MDEKNPYAPPKSSVEDARPRSSFDAPELVLQSVIARRPVVLVVMLSLVTLGYYQYYWLYATSRQATSDVPSQMGSSTKLLFLAIVLISLSFFVMVVTTLSAASTGGHDPESAWLVGGRLLGFAAQVLGIVWSFKVRDQLQSLVARRAVGPYPISAAGTFFFSIYYLQYKINRMPGSSTDDYDREYDDDDREYDDDDREYDDDDRDDDGSQYDDDRKLGDDERRRRDGPRPSMRGAVRRIRAR
jgi:hypothetical protein